MSPNGEKAIFGRDCNIWLYDTQRNQERMLTEDGEEFLKYGATGSAWGVEFDFSPTVQACWSFDSEYIVTVQRDKRRVKDVPIVDYVPQGTSVRPTVEFVKIAYPGDKYVECFRLVAIHIESGRRQFADYDPVVVTRNSWGFFSAGFGGWEKDNRTVWFIDVDRYYKYIRLVSFDVTTGLTKVLFEENSNTHINLANNATMWPSHLHLPETQEFLWFSDRTGWGHIYLYDMKTGKLKHAVTSGDWVVRDVILFDASRRELFLQTSGREEKGNPYYRDVVRVNIDSCAITEIATGDFDYFANAFTDMQLVFNQYKKASNDERGVSPTGNFVVVTRSRVNTVPKSELLDRDGNDVLTLELADISRLPLDWRWPEPVKLLAADGKTAIYGTVYRPSFFSSRKKWPIVSHVYNSPDFALTAQGSFENAIMAGLFFTDAAALAELGFIVIQIDGRGTPFRSKEFHDKCYGDVDTASLLSDHVAGIRQLAKRYPYMDIDRVGITCHPMGGPGGLQGLTNFPEFYKVGVQFHLLDSRLSAATMRGDLYEGNLESSLNYGSKYNVERIKGKLLIIGELSAETLRLVDELQNANKDFEMLLSPTLKSTTSPAYFIRKSWDFLVKNLQRLEPPPEFNLSARVRPKI